MALTNLQISFLFAIIKFFQVIAQIAMMVYISQSIIPDNQEILTKYRICTFIFLSINVVFVIGYTFCEKYPVTTFHSEVLIFLIMIVICGFVGLWEITQTSKYKTVDEKTVSLLYWYVLFYDPLLLTVIELLSLIPYRYARKNDYTALFNQDNNQTEDIGVNGGNEVIPLTTMRLPPQNPPAAIQNPQNRVNNNKVSVQGIPSKPIRREESIKVMHSLSTIPSDDSICV
ncbi:UNVERIFIED_CONTAM: hypothetical protein RMT77_007539 [Armadillidium vulgare]